MLRLNKIFFLLLITLFSIDVKGQDLVINGSIYKAGIYKTFDEFRLNEPSLPFSFEVWRRQKIISSDYSTNIIDYYQILDPNHKLNKIGKIYGFCDGKSVYVNNNLPKVSQKTKFFKLDCLDAYCYYESLASRVYPSSTKIVIATSSLPYRKIVNLKTSVATRLNVGFTKQIIHDDSLLYHAFKKEEKKKKEIRNYIFQYIEKHKKNPVLDNMGFRSKPGQVVIYRGNKRQTKNPIKFSVNDRVRDNFIPNSYFELSNISSLDSVEVCFGKDLGQCQKFVLEQDNSTFIECSYKIGDMLPTFIKVRISKGSFDSIKPEKIQRDRDSEN